MTCHPNDAFEPELARSIETVRGSVNPKVALASPNTSSVAKSVRPPEATPGSATVEIAVDRDGSTASMSTVRTG